MAKPKAIDLFSGAGGLSQGLRQAGFDVVGALEIDTDACEVFSANHPQTTLIRGDIAETSVEDALHQWGVKHKELDLLAGCPPCQGFSTIGTRNRSVSHDDARNNLIFQMLRFVEGLLPKVVMVENVPALARDVRLARFCQRLTDLGYSYDVKVLDVQQYNVPQRRKRMILLASRIGRITVRDVDLTWGRPKTVRSAFSNLKPDYLEQDALSGLVGHHTDHVMEIIRAIPHDGGSRRELPDRLTLECHKKTNGFGDVYGRMAWDMPSPTITCGCVNPSKGRFLHPEENRAISLREAAILQTFPLNYSFPVVKGRQKLSTMIGNALPPKFIEFHARCVAALLRSSS